MKLVERSFRLSAPDETACIPPATMDYLEEARLKPGEESPYAAILGVIPAEESDEDFAAAVAALNCRP